MLTGWVFQAGDIIQITVIQRLINGLAGLFDVPKIHHPAASVFDRSADVYGDVKRVPMEPFALVIIGHMRKHVSRFKSEGFEDFH